MTCPGHTVMKTCSCGLSPWDLAFLAPGGLCTPGTAVLLPPGSPPCPGLRPIPVEMTFLGFLTPGSAFSWNLSNTSRYDSSAQFLTSLSHVYMPDASLGTGEVVEEKMSCFQCLWSYRRQGRKTLDITS